MHIPRQFEEARVDVLHALMRDYPFASLITSGESGLDVNHLPFVLSPTPQPYGTLRCHVARANPVWRDLSTSMEAVVVFHGPHTYISPSWYPSKQEHGKVVPTWNYAVVHAYGQPRIVEDADWLTGLVSALTSQHESEQNSPWHVSDAPADFIDKMIRSIVGIEIPLRRIYGKWKQSQNRSLADRHGVVAALENRGEHEVAELIRRTTDS